VRFSPVLEEPDPLLEGQPGAGLLGDPSAGPDQVLGGPQVLGRAPARVSTVSCPKSQHSMPGVKSSSLRELLLRMMNAMANLLR
jgi:hypothetical protein